MKKINGALFLAGFVVHGSSSMCAAQQEEKQSVVVVQEGGQIVMAVPQAKVENQDIVALQSSIQQLYVEIRAMDDTIHFARHMMYRMRSPEARTQQHHKWYEMVKQREDKKEACRLLQRQLDELEGRAVENID